MKHVHSKDQLWAKLALHLLAIVVLDVAESSIVKANAALRRGKNLMGLAAHLRWAAEGLDGQAEAVELPLDDEAAGQEETVPPEDVPLSYGTPLDDDDPPPSGVRPVAGSGVVCGGR